MFWKFFWDEQIYQFYLFANSPSEKHFWFRIKHFDESMLCIIPGILGMYTGYTRYVYQVYKVCIPGTLSTTVYSERLGKGGGLFVKMTRRN